MKVVVQGSKTFDDYNVFMRSMAVALSSMNNDSNIEVYTVGPSKVNNFVTGFVNLSEDGMKARGMSIRKYSVPHSWVESHVGEVDYFIYLSNPGEQPSRLVRLAESQNLEVGIFRY